MRFKPLSIDMVYEYQNMRSDSPRPQPMVSAVPPETCFVVKYLVSKTDRRLLDPRVMFWSDDGQAYVSVWKDSRHRIVPIRLGRSYRYEHPELFMWHPLDPRRDFKTLSGLNTVYRTYDGCAP